MTDRKPSRYATRSSTHNLHVQKASEKASNTQPSDADEKNLTSIKKEPCEHENCEHLYPRSDTEECDTPSFRAMSAGSSLPTKASSAVRDAEWRNRPEKPPLEFRVEGGSVLFIKLQHILEETSLQDYLRFARLEVEEMARVLPILNEKGVNHFDLFLFQKYVTNDILTSWGISPGTSARMMLYAHMFYQYHVDLDYL